MKFSLDPQLRALIPPLAREEREQLEENLRKEGCRDALVVGYIDGRHILLDGHNRHDICSAEQIPFTVEVAPHVTTYQEAVNWVINNQLGRRNLTPEQVSYLRGKRYNIEKRQGTRTDLTSPHTEEKLHTAARLSSEYKVSRPTIERDGQFAAAVDTLLEVVGEDVRPKIIGGDSPLTRKEVVVLGRLAEREPEKAKKSYTRATADDGIPPLEPELVEAERKKRPSRKGRKQAFHIIMNVALGMAKVRTPQPAKQIQEWGKLLLVAVRQALHGVDEY